MSRLVPEGPLLLDPIKEDLFTMYSDWGLSGGKKTVSFISCMV